MEILTFKCNEINKSISFHGLWYFLSTEEPCSILSYDDILLLFPLKHFIIYTVIFHSSVQLEFNFVHHMK